MTLEALVTSLYIFVAENVSRGLLYVILVTEIMVSHSH